MRYQIRLNEPERLNLANETFIKQVSQLDVQTNESIYALFKKNEKELQAIKYRSHEVKKQLTLMSKMRCSFCSRIMAIDSSPSLKNSPTIEHIKEKINYPLLIYRWDNMLHSCSRCNNCRGEKIYKDLYLDPTKIDSICDYFTFKSDGSLTPNTNLNDSDYQRSLYMIELYNLNSESKKNLFMKNERKKFMEQISNPKFEQMLLLENIISEDDLIKSELVKFYSLYVKYRYYIKKGGLFEKIDQLYEKCN